MQRIAKERRWSLIKRQGFFCDLLGPALYLTVLAVLASFLGTLSLLLLGPGVMQPRTVGNFRNEDDEVGRELNNSCVILSYKQKKNLNNIFFYEAVDLTDETMLFITLPLA